MRFGPSAGFLLAAGALVAMSATVGATAAGATATPVAAHRTPSVHVSPSSAMVNSTVTITGAGFAPRHTVTLWECGTTDWIVPQQPCLSGNAVTVKANRAGRFTTTMTAWICPAWPGNSLPFPTERQCYVGVPAPSGVDTMQLAPYAPLVVSWP